MTDTPDTELKMEGPLGPLGPERRNAVDIFKPPVSLLVKLGSALVHFDEFTSQGGHEYDLHTARQLLADADVKEWIEKMTGAAMLPVKRTSPSGARSA